MIRSTARLVYAILLSASSGLMYQTFAVGSENALTPPMGWNSWNLFRGDADEAMVKTVADAMVSSGMRDAGYRYVVIDGGWYTANTSTPDPAKFPSGLKPVADYVHSKGLKFGLWTCIGDHNGSCNREGADARAWASWGVDYVKDDNVCYGCRWPANSWAVMRDSIGAAGRPMCLEICNGEVYDGKSPWQWGRGVGQLWRTGQDLGRYWSQGGGGEIGVMEAMESAVDKWQYAGPGGWNHPDMMQVGNSPLSTAESRSHFSLWCIMASPLIAGNDPRDMTAEIKNILTNREAIAVNQDSLGMQAKRVRNQNGQMVFVKTMRDSCRAALLFNNTGSSAQMSVSWSELGLKISEAARVRDLWQHKDMGTFSGSYGAAVPSHDVVMIQVFGSAWKPLSAVSTPRTPAAGGAGRNPGLLLSLSARYGAATRTTTGRAYDLHGQLLEITHLRTRIILTTRNRTLENPPDR